MMDHAADAAPDPDAERRWQEWRARGAASDRLTAKRMRVVSVLMGITLVAWAVFKIA
ncbi:MAG: hypothetical protein AB7G23_15515 [Vicinamibacterales bacterium]